MNSRSSETSRAGQGVGLVLEESNYDGNIYVKQILSGGSADRSGKIKVGDQVIRVGSVAVSGLDLDKLKAMIVGAEECDQRAYYLSGLDPGKSCIPRRSKPERNLQHCIACISSAAIDKSCADNNTNCSLTPKGIERVLELINIKLSSVALKHFKTREGPITMLHEQAVQETDETRSAEMDSILKQENVWLRRALQLAEDAICKKQQELADVRSAFAMSANRAQSRTAAIQMIQEQVHFQDNEWREAEFSLLELEEYRRTLEVKLGEAMHRNEWIRAAERQHQENQRLRGDILRDVIRRAEKERRTQEAERDRLKRDLEPERLSRLEAEARADSLEKDFQRLKDHRANAAPLPNHQPTRLLA